MTTLMTDLMQHLQKIHTDNPGESGCLVVAVPTAPHSVEHFEVKEVENDGRALVLHCQAHPADAARPGEEPVRPQTKRVRRNCAHNDYMDLC